jgi:hypothetical protein
MNTILPRHLNWLRLSTIFLLISLLGCTAPLSPTQAPPPAQAPTAAALQFFLTADNLPIQVTSPDGSTTDLAQGQTVPVALNTGIKVGAAGLGKLLYSDRVNVEILQNTDLVLSKLTEVTGGRIEATFNLLAGHTHIRTGENGKADVILKTDDATITTLVDDTDFTVCYAPGADGLTCHPVVRGSIKVFGKTGTQVYDGPSGGYTFNGQAPQPPVCFHEQEYNDWLAKMRNGQPDVPALGALVDQWYKTPCPDLAQVEPTATPSTDLSPTPESPLATDTPAPADTAEPSSTPSSTNPTATANQQAFCRVGPNKAYLPIADLFTGDSGAILGRFRLSKWMYVQFDKLAKPCWVAPSVVDVSGDLNTVKYLEVILPGSNQYDPPHNVTATRDGKKVIIQWQPVSRSSDDDRGYFLDLFVCQGGFYLWFPVSLETQDLTTYTVRDEPGCPVPSQGKIYTVDRHGYSKPAKIDWPQP